MVERVRRERARTNTVRCEEEVMTVVATSVSKGEEAVIDDKRKVIQVRRFMTDPAFVRVSAGVTRSTAPYESLRVDVAITVPCYVEEVDVVQRKLEEKVAVMLDTSIDNYLNEGE